MQHESERRTGGWIPRVLIAAVVVLVVLVVGVYLAGTRRSGVGGGAGAGPAEAVRFDPDEADAELGAVQELLSAAVQNKRDPRPLIDDARRVVERYPDYVPARLTYAQVLMLSGRREAGYEQLEKALEIEPAQPQAQVLAGTTAMRLERFTDAERHYAQAVALQPNEPKHRLMLATVQLRRNKYDQARETLLLAIRLDSSLDAAYAMLSDLYSAQNKISLALDQIDRALNNTAADQLARREIYLRKKAELLLRDNRPTDAMRTLRELPVQRLVDREISKELAAIWMRLRQPEQAANHYEQILILNPVADWAAERAAHYRLEAGQIDQARKNLEHLRSINPRDPRVAELAEAIRGAGE